MLDWLMLHFAKNIAWKQKIQPILSPILSPKFLTAVPPLFPWANGKSLVWDFTCRDKLAQTYVPQTSQESGKAAEIAEKTKLCHHQDLTKQ